MRAAKNLPNDFTVGNIFRSTLKYLFENWKNLILLFGTVFLVGEGIEFAMQSLIGPLTPGAGSGITVGVINLILEVACLPFIVWNKPFPLFAQLQSYSNEFRRSSRKAILWLILRGISLGLLMIGGWVLGYAVLPLWVSIPVGMLWGLLCFWVIIRTSFMGPILACGDGSKGGESIYASWKSLKGLTFKLALSYCLVFLSSGFVILTLILGRATIFEVVDDGTMQFGTKIFYFCTDIMIDVAMVVPLMVLVGVAYRLKRDAVLEFIKAD